MKTLLKKTFRQLLVVVLMVASSLSVLPADVFAANVQIRQEINITDAYLGSASGAYATSSEIIQIDPTKYTSATYYFEVVASSTTAVSSNIYLKNATSSQTVATINFSNSNTYTRYRSTAFTAPSVATEYKVVVGNEAVQKGVIASRVIILQSAASITNTETQIEIGSATTSASNTTTLPLQSPKYWSYNSSKWDGSPTFYVEATYKDNPVASSTIYSVSATATPTFYTYIGSVGVGYVVGEAWGGGGGGDGVSSAATIGGGGGAGGTYARSTTSAITAGSTNIIGVGRGGAEGLAAAATASSTVTMASGVLVRGQGGEGATSNAGGVASTASSIGSVLNAGGSGGAGDDTGDTGGAGGGAGGPDGAGVTPANATNGVPVGGGAGNNSLGGAGGAAGTGADDVCDTENGKAGANNVLGGGGGGGGDGDTSSICTGGAGGRPGGGGGGSDEGTGTSLVEIGGPGQVKITEYVGMVGIALEEDNGSFGSWTFKQQIITGGKTSTTTERIRSSAFTPTNGRHYRITASTTNATASYDIYNAKIVVDQGPTSFTALNATGATKNWWGVSVNSTNGDVYAAVQSGDIYKQTAGSGSFNALNATGATKSWWGVSVNSTNGDVYASVSNGDIYKQTAGSGSFNALNATGATKSWRGVSVNSTNGDVYATVFGGDIYKQTAGTGNFTALNATGATKSWWGVSVNSTNGDVYAAVQNGDIYKQTAGTALTLLEPQYLLSNTKLATGTGLQNYLGYWDSTEWAGVSNTYLHQMDASASSASAAGIYTTANALVVGSTVTSPNNSATSSSMTMPATGNLDVKATTNNNDVYANRILAQVAILTNDVTSATVTPGDTLNSLAWTNPSDASLSKVMVLASTSAITFTPVNGTTYSTSTLSGASRVACYGLQASCTDTSLSNGTAYHYKIFTLSSNGYWSTPGVTPTGSPATPVASASTALSDTTDPSNATLAPSASATMGGAFTFQTTTGTDVVTAAVVGL
ncbi:hypothetical protein KW785_00595, partial [Candidatus Parcubacteria bacterium]|nr:hypothetical protein [Candidatus Parcubacteria bacterium]